MTALTIKDIAKDLKFSISTVSKALNDSKEISEETKQTILGYAKAHNYVPNKSAQGLKSKRLFCLGIVLNSHYTSIFWPQVLEGINQKALEMGYDIVIMQSREKVRNEQICLETLLKKGVDGILIGPVNETSNTDYIRVINERHCPVVLIDRINSDVDLTKIGVNEFDGALEATELLIERGRKKIMYITGNKFGESNPRFLGFLQALKNNKISLDKSYKILCNLSDNHHIDDTIRASLTSLAAQGNLPDAIFGATDTITMRTLGVLAGLNIVVPDQIAVVGFANTDMPYSFNPPLSTIEQPLYEMGCTAAIKLDGLITNRIDKKSHVEHETILFNTSLHVRKSADI